MTLRTLAREIRDYPATACFSLIWILVFVALLFVRMREQPAPGLWRFLVLGIGDGHRFGDLTLHDSGREESGRQTDGHRRFPAPRIATIPERAAHAP